MSAIKIHCPKAPKSAVIPVERPTVPNAESASKSVWESVSSRVRHQRQRADHDRTEGDRGDCERLPLGVGWEPAREGRHVRVAAHLGPHHEREEGQRRHLDAASGRRAPRSDEHEEVGDEERLQLHLAVVHRVEARRAGRHSLEEASEELPADPERAEGSRVPPLEGEHRARPADDQDCGHEQGQLRVQAPAVRPSPEPRELEPDREAEASGDDQEGDRHADPPVACKRGQVVGPEREARVVERGDRVKDPQVDRAAERVVVRRPPAHGEDGRANRLEEEAELDDCKDKTADVGQEGRGDLRLGEQTATQPEPAGEQEDEQRGQGHDPEPAHLDEQHDHDLSEGRPVRGGVHHDEAGDADRRGRGEDRRRGRVRFRRSRWRTAR